jgi:hypothetical protein
VARENTPQTGQPTKAVPVTNMQTIPVVIWNFFSGLPLIPSAKAVAESWLSRGELWLVIFAFIIGAGLLGEDRAERKEKSWIPPSLSGWNWRLIFIWFVIVGVIGELFCDAIIWVSSDALQTISDGEILALNKEIAPRRLQPEQQEAIRNDLMSFGGKTVALSSYVLDVEGAILLLQIKDILEKANARVAEARHSDAALA